MMTRFFQVFDLAFLAPGFVLFSCWLYCFEPYSIAVCRSAMLAGDSTATVLAVTLACLCSSFLAGLACHVVTWTLIWRLPLRPWITAAIEKWRKRYEPETRSASLAELLKNQPSDGELAKWVFRRVDYFWYIRSTCYNTSVAICVAYVTLVIHSLSARLPELVRITGVHLPAGWWWTGPLLAVSLWVGGEEFDAAYHRYQSAVARGLQSPA